MNNIDDPNYSDHNLGECEHEETDHFVCLRCGKDTHHGTRQKWPDHETAEPEIWIQKYTPPFTVQGDNPPMIFSGNGEAVAQLMWPIHSQTPEAGPKVIEYLAGLGETIIGALNALPIGTIARLTAPAISQPAKEGGDDGCPSCGGKCIDGRCVKCFHEPPSAEQRAKDYADYKARNAPEPAATLPAAREVGPARQAEYSFVNALRAMLRNATPAQLEAAMRESKEIVRLAKQDADAEITPTLPAVNEIEWNQQICSSCGQSRRSQLACWDTFHALRTPTLAPASGGTPLTDAEWKAATLDCNHWGAGGIKARR